MKLKKNRKKYRLLPAEIRVSPFDMDKGILARRVVALRDIPRHGVKEGDWGGFVAGESTLSHDGDCWVGEYAVVLDYASVKGNALVSGYAAVMGNENSYITISENAQVHGSALVLARERDDMDCSISGESIVTDRAVLYVPSLVTDNAFIHQSAKIMPGVSVVNNADIAGDAVVGNDCRIKDHSMIFSKVHIPAGTTVEGNSYIFGELAISDGANLKNAFRTGNILKDWELKEGYEEMNINDFKDLLLNTIEDTIETGDEYETNLESSLQDHDLVKVRVPDAGSFIRGQMLGIEGAFAAKQLPAIDPLRTVSPAPAISRKALQHIQVLEEIKTALDAYETDIVKMLKFPIMTDPAHPETASMMMALRVANRAVEMEDSEEIIESVKDLEHKFVVAESKARRVASTHLSEVEKKKTDTAGKLFALALDEGASETERRNAFKQGLRQLEGVIAVPESTVKATVSRMGLGQLEA